MLWISLAAAVYVLAGLGSYFFGFHLFKKLNELSSRFGGGILKNRDGGSASVFEPPHSRLVIFFKGLGVFLVLAGVTFFLVMMHGPAPLR